MNQTSLVGRPLHSLVTAMVGFAEKRGVWSGPLTSSSPELARLWAAPPTSTGVSVSEMSALTYSTVWACVNNISTDIASLPLILYKTLPNGGKQRLTDHKLYRILHDEPNPEMSSMTYRGMVQAHVLTWGNGYSEIQRDGAGRVVALWPITPDRVSVKRDMRTGVIYYDVARVNGDGIDQVDALDMLHIQGLGYDGSVGYNLIAKAREAIGLALATERFGGSFFGNGATFGGVIALKQQLTEAAKKSFGEQMMAQHQGVDRAHKFLLLGNEAEYQKLGVDPDHAQFLETRMNQVEEICRYYRMPPHKVQHLQQSTNNNIEHQGIEYYSDTLRPWCVRWEQEIKRKLIAPSERMIQFAEHKIEGVLRGDLKSRYDAYAVGRQWGWLSANRICELENMDPLPAGGDVFLVPMNMSPADRLNEIIDKQVAPTPAPPVPPSTMAQTNSQDEAAQAARMTTAIREALTDVEARIAATTEQITLVRSEKAQTYEAAEALKTQLETLQAKQMTAEQEAGRLRALLLEATERADRFALERDTLKMAATEAEASLRTQVEAAHAEVQTVQASAAAEATRLQAVADETAAQAAFLAVERDTLRVAQEQATARVAELDSALAGTKDEAEAAKVHAVAEAARLQAELAETAARAAQVEADRDAAKATAAAAAATVEKLTADLATADAMHAGTSRTLVAEHTALELAQGQLAELQRAIEDTRREAARLEAERDVAQADAALTAQAADAAHWQAADAAATLATATADAEAARQLLEEETGRLAEERAAHAATQAAMQRQHEADSVRNQTLIEYHRDMVQYAVGLLVNKEIERARRNSGTPAKLQAWADGYYLLHADNMVDALRAVMKIHLAFIGSMVDVDTYTRALVQPHLELVSTQLRAVAGGDPEAFPVSVDKLLAKWERERPAALASVVFQEEMSYVRSL